MTYDALIQSGLRKMCMLLESGEFAPLLEADVCALVYHMLVNEQPALLKRLHMCARIIGGGDADKPDIVIGDVGLRDDGRPAVQPEVVVEVKVFPTGFRDQQCRRRLEHILADDLRKLGGLAAEPIMKMLLIYDALDYLSGRYQGQNRRQAIVQERDGTAPGTRILVVSRSRNGWTTSVL